MAANSTKEALGLDQNRVLSTDSVVTLENFQISVPKSGSSIDGVPSALLTLAAGQSETGLQRKESLTTVSFAVAQFDSSQKPYVAFGNVPKAASRRWMEQSFASAVGYRQRTFDGFHPPGGSCAA